MNKNIKTVFTFTILTIIVGFILSIVYVSTKDIINKRSEERLYESYKKVSNDFDNTNDLTKKALLIKNYTKVDLISFIETIKDGEINGYIINTKTKGYGGDIYIMIGFDTENNIIGITYPQNINETPGIGQKITLDSFLNQFINKNIDNINEVNAISGATISSTAVKNAVKFSLNIINNVKNIS